MHNIGGINMEQKSDAVDDVKVAVMRLDTPKEIFDLWYEIFYLRAVLSEIIRNNSQLTKYTFDESRKMAQYWMKERFPKANLEYSEKI